MRKRVASVVGACVVCVCKSGRGECRRNLTRPWRRAPGCVLAPLGNRQIAVGGESIARHPATPRGFGAAPCGHFASLVRSIASQSARLPSETLARFCGAFGVPSYENKSQAGRIALAISASRSEVPDLCLSPIRSEGRWTSLHSIIRLAGVQPRKRALWRQGTLALTRGRDIQADLDWAAAISLALLLS